MDRRLTIQIEPKTKKNSQKVIRVGGFYRIAQSDAYKAYEKQASALLLQQIPEEERSFYPILTPVNVQAVYYRRTRIRVDITNLESALMDVLVKAGILADDCCTIVVSTDGSRVRYDKENPRTEIRITSSDDADPEFWNTKGRKKK